MGPATPLAETRGGRLLAVVAAAFRLGCLLLLVTAPTIEPAGPGRLTALWAMVVLGVGRWLRQTAGPDRLVLLAAVAVRGAATAIVGYGLALVCRHVPHPGWSLLLALAIAG
jgi:hypothetical protein